jgi:hypothetical protein
MYVRHQLHLNHPVMDARKALLSPPETWLPSAHAVGQDWRRLLARVGFGPPGLHLSKKVSISVGLPQDKRDWLDIPIFWRATGASDLFPIMEGHLRLEPTGPTSSRLSFSGSYKAPLGVVGREIDDAVMHNLAEATVRDLVDHVARRVSDLVAAATPRA